MNEWGYTVRDDSNKMATGTEPQRLATGGAPDHDREGSAHNIHMAARDAPSRGGGSSWSAGRRSFPVRPIGPNLSPTPGLTMTPQWITFLDSRDIPTALWTPCESEDGTYACPWQVRSFPFNHSGNTNLSHENRVNQYNCSTANESGPEVRYLVNIREPGQLTVTVSVDDESSIDPDVHLLWGDDAKPAWPADTTPSLGGSPRPLRDCGRYLGRR